MGGVVCEDVRQPIDPGLQIGVLAQAQINHPGVRESSCEDQFSKVAIIGDEDALLAPGDGSTS